MKTIRLLLFRFTHRRFHKLDKTIANFWRREVERDILFAKIEQLSKKIV